MSVQARHYISLMFVILAVFELFALFFMHGNSENVMGMIILLLIAVIISYFRTFIVFVFYLIVIGIIIVIISMIVLYILGLNISQLAIINHGYNFMFFLMGDLSLTIGISAFLTKKTRDGEERRKAENERGYQEGIYDKPPNANDFNRFNEQKEREEQEEREKNAYERGKREAQIKNNEMTEEEAHKILGVKQGASREEIRKAYRKLSKIIHPDATHLDTDEIMKQVNKAYGILMKGEK